MFSRSSALSIWLESRLFDQIDNIRNELYFFITIFDKSSFSRLDMLFKNWDFHYKKDMV